jgi:hypothetical protein
MSGCVCVCVPPPSCIAAGRDDGNENATYWAATPQGRLSPILRSGLRLSLGALEGTEFVGVGFWLGRRTVLHIVSRCSLPHMKDITLAQISWFTREHVCITNEEFHVTGLFGSLNTLETGEQRVCTIQHHPCPHCEGTEGSSSARQPWSLETDSPGVPAVPPFSAKTPSCPTTFDVPWGKADGNPSELHLAIIRGDGDTSQ